MIKKHEIQLQVARLCMGNYNTCFYLIKKGDVNQLNQLKKKRVLERDCYRGLSCTYISCCVCCSRTAVPVVSVGAQIAW